MEKKKKRKKKDKRKKRDDDDNEEEEDIEDFLRKKVGDIVNDVNKNQQKELPRKYRQKGGQ